MPDTIETINLMDGVPPKDQWVDAVNTYAMVIESNLVDAKSQVDRTRCDADGLDELSDVSERLDSAMRVLVDFKEEMLRFVDAVFRDAQ